VPLLLSAMKRRSGYKWIVFFILFNPVYGKTSDIEVEKTTIQLKKLSREIIQLQSAISKEDIQKKELTTVLKQHQCQLDMLYHQISALKSRYQKHHIQHEGLQTRYRHHNDRLQLLYEESKALLTVIYSLIYSYDQPLIQAYCYHLYQLHHNKIIHLHQELKGLHQTINQIQRYKQIAQDDLYTHERHHLKLEQKMKIYTQQLYQLQGHLKSRQARLQQLTQDKVELNALITRLTQHKLSGHSILTSKQGKLPWPIYGKLVRRYGECIEHSELKTTGVYIAVKPNQIIKSVACGKVVFADHLRGLGALIVIEHGQGDLSLYGYNARLLKKKGDKVEEKEALAVSTSHAKNNVVYFELRKSGHAIDPELWCVPLQ
jgi:septal ring factor EnvC (AmiA/AmiB activator)